MVSSPKSRPNTARQRTVRIGAVIAEVLDKNLELYCLKAGVSKQEAFTTALRQFLEKNGMDPDRLPKINLSY